MWDIVKYAVKQAYQSTFQGYNCEFTDLPDLRECVWLVTGSTSGIGTELAKTLVKRNATVVLAGRSKQKLDDTIKVLKEEVPDCNLDTMIFDYLDIHTIKPAVDELKTKYKELHGIIHNAGVMNTPKGVTTKQGIEATFGVNNVATQYLQNLLDPLIANTYNSRIVWMSSLAHAFSPYNGFDPAKIDSLSPETIYASSKALDYIQSVQWSLNHKESPTFSVSCHPGVIKSNLSRTTSKSVFSLVKLLAYDTEYGALSPTFAALSPDVENNDYIVPFGMRGDVRPDVYRAARNELGAKDMAWINVNIQNALRN